MIPVRKSLDGAVVKTVPFAEIGRSTAFRDRDGALVIKLFQEIKGEDGTTITNAVFVDDDGDFYGVEYDSDYPCTPLPDLVILTGETT